MNAFHSSSLNEVKVTVDKTFKKVSLTDLQFPMKSKFPTSATTFKGDLVVYVGGYPSAMKGWMLKHVSGGCGNGGDPKKTWADE